MEPLWRASVVTLGLLVAAAFLTPAPAAAAPPNALSAPTVSPPAGTTATTFVFGVAYDGRDPAVSVTAAVGGQTVPMQLVSGSSSDGTYTGASTLPAGTWTVTFTAIAQRGNDPVIGGGSVQVAAPTPPPASTLTPPPAAPTPVGATPAPPPPAGPVAPAPAAPAPTTTAGETPAAAPGGTTGTSPSNAPGGAAGPALASDAAAGAPRGAIFTAEPTVAPARAGLVPARAFGDTDWAWRLMLGGLGLIGLVGLWGLLLGARARRRHRAEQAALPVAMSGSAPAAVDERPRTPAVWELDAQLEEERIGTIDFVPGAEEDVPDRGPAVVPSEPSPKRLNPRSARIEAARTSRTASRRRQPLEGDEATESA